MLLLYIFGIEMLLSTLGCTFTTPLRTPLTVPCPLYQPLWPDQVELLIRFSADMHFCRSKALIPAK